MRKMKVVKSLLVSAAMLGMLTACGTKKDSKADKSSDDGKPIRVWSSFSQPSSTVKSWKESPFHSGLEKASGVKVDWEFPAEGTDAKQAFNLMISDSDMPEIIGDYMRNNADQLISDGVIQDLTDLIPEKAPNYAKFLKENPNLAREVTTDSGKVFAFGAFREDPVQGAVYGPIVRKDWLDENNLSVPTNIEEWTNTLKVFKDKYGATFSFVPKSMNRAGLAGAFGGHGNFKLYYYLDNKKIKVGQIQPEWKDYISWLHDLYKDGLLDPDFVTMDDESLKTKVANNKVGMIFDLPSRKSLFNGNKTVDGKQPDWEWIPYPNQANGDKTADYFTQGQVQNPTWAISSSAKGKKLDEAMKWLDYAYSEEGEMYWNFGEKGKTWNEVNGEPVWTDEIVKNSLGEREAKKLYTGNSGSGLGVQLLKSTGNHAEFTKDDVAGYLWDPQSKEASDSRFPEGLTKTAEESKEYATIANTIETYLEESAVKFVTGEKPLSEFDDFVKEMKNQNLDRLVEIQQAAYDRYLKR